MRPKLLYPNAGGTLLSKKALSRLRGPLELEEVQHHKVAVRGIVTYVSALLLIAAFSIAFYFVTDHIVRQQETTARVMNLTGRQRMLAQRVVRLGLERAAHLNYRPDAETDADLSTNITLLAQTHEGLLHGSAALRVSAPTEAQVLAVHHDAPYRLDEQMASFLAHARAFAARPASEMTTADTDLAAMDYAVKNPCWRLLPRPYRPIRRAPSALSSICARCWGG